MILYQNLIQVLFLIFPSLVLLAPLAAMPLLLILALLPLITIVKNKNYSTFLYSTFISNRLNQLLIIALVYSIASAFWSVNPSDTFLIWPKLLAIFILSLAYLYDTETNTTLNYNNILPKLTVGFIIGLGFLSMELMLNNFVSSKIFNLFHNHKFSILEFNRGACILSVMAWPVLYYVSRKYNYKTAALLWFVTFLAISRLESLSACAAFFISGIFIFPITYKYQAKSVKLLAVLAMLAVFVVNIGFRMLDAHEIVGKVPAIKGAASDYRLYIWSYSAQKASERPFLGWGLNAARNFPCAKEDYLGDAKPIPLHTHNNSVQVWLELGLVGVFMFAGFLYYVVKSTLKYQEDRLKMACFMAFLANYFIIGQLAFGIWQNWWIATGVLVAGLLKASK